jgi:hypothetical protein
VHGGKVGRSPRDIMTALGFQLTYETPTGESLGIFTQDGRLWIWHRELGLELVPSTGDDDGDYGLFMLWRTLRPNH